MTNEEKAYEVAKKHMPFCGVPITECISAALEIAEWKDSQPQIIEIFGKRVKIVSDDGSAKACMNCALFFECKTIKTFFLCESAEKNTNRHFVEVDEDGHEIGGEK